jgi:hypothetical protein
MQQAAGPARDRRVISEAFAPYLHLDSAGAHRPSAVVRQRDAAAADALRLNAHCTHGMLLRSSWHNIRLKENQSRSG